MFPNNLLRSLQFKFTKTVNQLSPRRLQFEGQHVNFKCKIYLRIFNMVLYYECKWLKSRDMKMRLTCFFTINIYIFLSRNNNKKKKCRKLLGLLNWNMVEISSGKILNFLFIIYFKECSYLISIKFDYDPLRDVW